MFKITIEQTKPVKKIVGKDWAVIGSKEVPRERGYWEKDNNEPKTRIEDVRGYTPEIEKTTIETTTILTQQVESLDLAAVIKAINGI